MMILLMMIMMIKDDLVGDYDDDDDINMPSLEVLSAPVDNLEWHIDDNDIMEITLWIIILHVFPFHCTRAIILHFSLDIFFTPSPLVSKERRFILTFIP